MNSRRLATMASAAIVVSIVASFSSLRASTADAAGTENLGSNSDSSEAGIHSQAGFKVKKQVTGGSFFVNGKTYAIVEPSQDQNVVLIDAGLTWSTISGAIDTDAGIGVLKTVGAYNTGEIYAGSGADNEIYFEGQSYVVERGRVDIDVNRGTMHGHGTLKGGGVFSVNISYR